MNRYGVMARSHWARWLPQRYATISDPDSFFSTLGQETAQQIDELAAELAGERPARGGLPGEGGPADRGPQPGGGDHPAAADPAAPGAGDERGPGGDRPGDGERGTAAGHRPQPPAVGGGERRAGGTGPGQLTARAVPAERPGRPRPLRNGRPHPREPGRAHHAPRHPARGHRPATPDEQAVLARWSGWGAVPEVFDPDRRAHYLGPRRAVPPADRGRAVRGGPQHPERPLHRRRPGPGRSGQASSSWASPAAGSWNPAADRATSSASRPAAPGSPAWNSSRSPPRSPRRSTRTPTSSTSPSPASGPARTPSTWRSATSRSARSP